MKTLMIVAALAAAMTSPALAKTSQHSHRVHAHAAPAEVVQGQDQYQAQYPNAVYFAGVYVGADPDPNIRTSLAHEYLQGAW